MQLGGDAHVHVDIEGIVVRDEGARIRAARDGAQNRRLDLHKADGVEVAAQIRDKLRTNFEVALGLGVDDQVHIALTVARFLIGQAVVLLRQGMQRLTEQRDLLGAHAHLAALGAEHLALDADDIADVVLLEAVIGLLVHLVLPGVDLDAAGLVLQIAEGWTVEIDPEIHQKLNMRTDPTWPTTWFVPRLCDKSAFKDVYSVMNNWGANHGAISYGHIGQDLITLASMLRIPVCMHNVDENEIFRPTAWNAFGMDKEGADYRACTTYGPIYK